MSSEIISRSCFKIKQQDHITNEELTLLFNDIVQELSKLKSETSKDSFIRAISEIISLLENEDTEKVCKSCMFNHEVFVLIRDALIILFNKWRTNETLNEQEIVLLQKTSEIFWNMIQKITDTNVVVFKTLLLNESFIESIKLCVDDITANGKQSDDHILSVLDTMIWVLGKLMNDRKEVQDDPTLLTLLDSIVKCICSARYLDTFKQLCPEDSEVTVTTQFLLVTCPHYVIYYYDGERMEEIVSLMRQTKFDHYLEIFGQFMQSIEKWNSSLIKAMSYATGILQYISAGEVQRQKYLDLHLKLMDYIIVILKSPNINELLKGYVTTALSRLIYTAIVYLFGLSIDPTFLTIIKENELAQTFLTLTEANDDMIQVNTYRLLAMILDENEIKTLANPAKITRVFRDYIEMFIDNMLRKMVLQNTLLSLKSRYFKMISVEKSVNTLLLSIQHCF
ncbi:unnamed protein product [Didymodactylos carnosus]|uniref:Uncharacterized protein n=1 Tax=Didymodactylos carnosus TaxID=1234261 RepID=A0A815WQQ9_9BILA|nr:unnamed protein product [Didymodactylos carnosus]CAF1552313.1 unnamed protein product [Didymodactylos carnosus]CAF4200384.1 unnamed protein product [Didymodactylos carnosus]CAF4413338.1 unnamed protein product [Didymodactylos carnosus]